MVRLLHPLPADHPAAAWADLLDGSRDVDGLLTAAAGRGVGPLDLLAQLRALGDGGLLAGFGRPAPAGVEVQGAAGLLRSVVLPSAVWRWLAWLGLGLAVLVAGGSVLAETSAVPPWSAIGWALPQAWVFAALLWSLRNLARGLGLSSLGRPAERVVVRLRWGLLHLGLDERHGLTPEERATAAWAGMAGLCATLALAWTAGWQPLRSAALLALLLDLAPWLRGDGRELLALRLRVPSLLRRSRAWLLRRSMQRLLAAAPVAPEERAYLTVASLWLLHGLVVLALLLVWLVPAATVAAFEASRPDRLTGAGLPLPWALVPAGLLAAAAVVGVLALFRVVTGFVVQVLRGQPRPVQPLRSEPPSPELAARSLAALPFLAALGPDRLAQLASTARREGYRDGETVFRQGDAGDRLCCIVAGRADVVVDETSGLAHRVATLGEGDVFGEAALVSAVPRTATVRAAGELSVLSVARDDFLAAMVGSDASAEAVRTQVQLAASIRHHPLFQGLGSRALRRLMEAARLEDCPVDAVVVAQGAPGTELFVVRDGTFAVERDGKPVATLEAGQWFGELALLGQQVRTATVRAATAGRLVVLPKAAVDEALLQDVAAAGLLHELAAERWAALQRTEAA